MLGFGSGQRGVGRALGSRSGRKGAGRVLGEERHACRMCGLVFHAGQGRELKMCWN